MEPETLDPQPDNRVQQPVMMQGGPGATLAIPIDGGGYAISEWTPDGWEDVS